MRMLKVFIVGMTGTSLLISAGAVFAAAPVDAGVQANAPQDSAEQPTKASKARKGGIDAKRKSGFGPGAVFGVLGAVGAGGIAAAAAGGGNGGSPASP